MTSSLPSPGSTPGSIRCSDVGVVKEAVGHRHVRVPNSDVQVLFEIGCPVNPTLPVQLG